MICSFCSFREWFLRYVLKYAFSCFKSLNFHFFADKTKIKLTSAFFLGDPGVKGIFSKSTKVELDPHQVLSSQHHFMARTIGGAILPPPIGNRG